MSEEEKKIEWLKGVFKLADKEGNGRLSLDEFKELLRKGNPNFPEDHAETLFCTADQDLSGGVDFDELVEYIFNNTGVESLFLLERSATEEEAKAALLSKDGLLRAAASKAAKAKGVVWRDLTWQERLEEVLEVEREAKEDTQARKDKAPVNAPLDKDRGGGSRYAAVDNRASSTKKKVFDIEEVKQRHRENNVEDNVEDAVVVAQAITRKPTLADVPASALRGSSVAAAQKLAKNKFGIADKTQAEMVDYSLAPDDLDFVGGDGAMLDELREFKHKLKTVDDPLSLVNVVKFIAKGTAGWVFLVEHKATGKKVAMKLIRMTQARSGIREWYLSKVMREHGISNVVFTEESVCVFERASAPPVIEEELRHAGPVPYYMALFQVLMPWGTLEDIAKDGEVNPFIMFKCLQDVAETLAQMHALNISHRDMKPENVMLFMQGGKIKAARLCDLGRAEISNNPESRKDDIRRFGITFFSVATGEGWTKNRLLREQPDALVSRLAAALEGTAAPSLQRCPELLRQILAYELDMAEISECFNELEDQYKSNHPDCDKQTT